MYRAENGVPLPKATKIETFVPPSVSGAKDDIASKNFGLHDNPDFEKKKKEQAYYMLQKGKQKHGEFKKAYYYDNGTSVD